MGRVISLGAKKSGAEEKSLTGQWRGWQWLGAGVEKAEEGKGFQFSPSAILGEAGIELGVA